MILFDRFNLGHGFTRYFEIRPAINDVLREEVYRIRHEVYCEDLGYEPERPDRREIDEYDAHSLHCLLRTSTEPSQAVGCARLVMTRPGEPDYPLPFEHTCAQVLDRSIIDPARLSRASIAEVSRLAVRSAYRRRREENAKPFALEDADFGSTKKPRFPYVPVGLYLGAIALAARNDIELIFVLTEPRLAEHFAKLGVEVRRIGGPVEHRGTRVPSVLDVQAIIKNMRFFFKPIWRVIQDEIETAYVDAERAQRTGA